MKEASGSKGLNPDDPKSVIEARKQEKRDYKGMDGGALLRTV